MYSRYIKPLFDFWFAVFLLLLTSPVLILALLLLSLDLKGNPVFTQLRPGLNAQCFTLYKLKTMRDTRGKDGELLSDHQRMTPLGAWIRKRSIDELPQLFNVLKGEMSFVGPRPLLPEYLPLYSEEQRKRHQVKPGISGWAQVNGRNTVNWKEKFTLDIWYVEHQSFVLDIKIVIKTLFNILRSKDVNASDTSTMEPFNGKN
jgi:undecaprenyl phosphate N,N'-diacetylbacillosamine 1-phosphate transferase